MLAGEFAAPFRRFEQSTRITLSTSTRKGHDDCGWQNLLMVIS